MNPNELQELVADLLRAMDYHVAWVAPPGKDGGVDVLAFTDPDLHQAAAGKGAGETAGAEG